MPRQQLIIGPCPQCDSGELACSYNHFEKEDLTIDAWEHRCANCGFRETKAYRSDEAPEGDVADPGICPYCRRKADERCPR